MEARKLDLENPFDGARVKLDEMAVELESQGMMALTHSEVEAFIDREGTEILRRLFQAHLDLRSQAQAAAVVRGADGVRRTHRRLRSVPLKTVVGTVTVTREAHSARGHESLHPLDAALNLTPDIYSHGVRRRVAIEAAKGSFQETVDSIERGSGTTVPKRQAEELVRRAAEDFDAFYEERRADGAAKPAQKDSFLVISTDGKGIAMRKEDLRAATRKAAETKKPKLKTRLSKGEKRHRKRMALVATVYTVAPFVRAPEDIVRDLDGDRDAIRRPRPEHKRVWASIAKPPEAVMDEAFAEALSRDPKRKRRWAALVDGHEVQLSNMLVLAEHYRVELTIILDVIHVLEYLWDAAWVFHAEGSSEAEAWVRERLLEILRGRSSAVAGGIRRSATLRALGPEARRPVDECADYLIKYRDYLHYDRYLAEGLPIATGVIEGACRHLVQDRMGRTGARWGLASAEAVLRVRALMSSGDFDAYWAFHESCELTRNHRALYASGRLPRLVIPPRKRPAKPGLRLVRAASS